MRAGTRATSVLLAALLLAGCGAQSGGATKESEAEKEKEGFSQAADTKTCVADAKPFSGAEPAGYPADFPLPQGAVLYNIEDRGEQGVVSTAIVQADLKTVLADLNGPAQQAGFKVTSGETEEHDAEANWEGGGYRGRWAIRDSATCDGEVVIQLLSKKQ